MEREPGGHFVARSCARKIRARRFTAPRGKRVRADGASRGAASGVEARSGTENHQVQDWGGSSAPVDSDAGRAKRRRRKLQRGSRGVLVYDPPADQSPRKPCGGKIQTDPPPANTQP